MTYDTLLSILTAQKQPMLVQFELPVKPRLIVFGSQPAARAVSASCESFTFTGCLKPSLTTWCPGSEGGPQEPGILQALKGEIPLSDNVACV